jgi:hypothetical protein
MLSDEIEFHQGIGDDRLRGAPAIGAFIGEDNLKVVYYELETGLIPAGKSGKVWVASKAVLRAHYRDLTSPPSRTNGAGVTESGADLAPPSAAEGPVMHHVRRQARAAG